MVRPRLAACSVAWNTETLELESADGRTQVVDILWRDALEAVQQHFLTTPYVVGELQFEPRIADRLDDQVFDDYCNSFLYYLEWSYLPDGQYPLLYELSSDASQFGNCRQQFWSVYVTPCLPCKEKRQRMGSKILVGQLPHVEGADEKAEMYQHAIRKIFESMNAAGHHGVLMSFPGTEPAAVVMSRRSGRQASACRGRRRLRDSARVPARAHDCCGQPGALHPSWHPVRIRHQLPVLGVLDAQGCPRRLGATAWLRAQAGQCIR